MDEQLTLETLVARLIAPEERITTLERDMDEHTHGEDASLEHYHDEYASARLVERLEYRLNEHDRRIDSAQYSSDEAKRDVERHANDYYKHGNRY